MGLEVVVGMFLLRVVLPVTITVLAGYALHRLDVKWHPLPRGIKN